MIFNLSQGGVAHLSVTAPSGASITAECLGLTLTGTGTCTLEAPIIGEWIVTCVLEGQTKTNTVNVELFGQTYATTFTYGATITVTSQPGAAITAAKSGMANVTGTADENGSCTLAVPVGCIGEWSVTANNSATSATKTVTISAYDTTENVSIIESVPIIEFTFGDDTYTYKGAEINISNKVKVSPLSDVNSGWKMWLRDSGTVKFKYLKTNVDLFAVGKGTGGGYYRYVSPNDYAGGGGAGGQIDTKLNQSIAVNTDYSFIIGSSGSSFSSIISAGVGGGAPGGGGAATIDTGWSSPTHPQYSYSPPGDGGNGQYAFGDSTFDGTVYGHGGQGGNTNYSDGKRGSTSGDYANPGAGGAGGGQGNNNPTGGNIGILIMRNVT